jgi:UDP-N-acetylmuramoylalanine--D-glutamate ligase
MARSTIAVVGLGKSGQAAARLCSERGARVVGLDARAREQLPAAVHTLGIELRLGEHIPDYFADVDAVIVSPGVPQLSLLDQVEERGVPVIGELELASRFIDVPIIAVGGTNGKSTTTMLTASILAATGEPVFAGGNLGEPACSAVGQAGGYCVLEVSSFQLERVPTFCPKVSLLLNISEDHLDRYPDFEAYAAAKGNAFVHQQPEDFAVYPTFDRQCERQVARGHAARIRFGKGGEYTVEGRQLTEVSSGHALDLSGVRVHGRHNLDNLAAAVAATRALGVSWHVIERGLDAFEPLPHRMQLVTQYAGLNFYDDSKATNVGAAVTAVRGLSEERCVLIAGGRDKLGSYEPLVDALQQRGRALVLLGEAADAIAVAASGKVRCERAQSMEEAVRLATELAQPGDAVLLSPACSSFDMFSSYAERGRAFADAVNSLAGSPGS